jgi:hypothetical protein
MVMFLKIKVYVDNIILNKHGAYVMKQSLAEFDCDVDVVDLGEGSMDNGENQFREEVRCEAPKPIICSLS